MPKITDLTAITTFSGDETFPVVEDDDGTPVTRKVTVENLAVGLAAQAGFTGTYVAVVTGLTAGGVVDNAAVLQAALDAAETAGGGTVILPVGVFAHTTPLGIASNVRLIGMGRGSVLKDTTGNLSQIDLDAAAVGVEIAHLRLTGSGILGTAGRGAIKADGGASRVSIHHVWIDACGTCGIVGAALTDSHIGPVWIDGGAEHGIYLSTGCARVTLDGIHLTDIGGDGGVSTVSGIKLADTDDGIVITNYTIDGSLSSGIQLEDTVAAPVVIGPGSIRDSGLYGIRVIAGAARPIVSDDIDFSGNASGDINGLVTQPDSVKRLGIVRTCGLAGFALSNVNIFSGNNCWYGRVLEGGTISKVRVGIGTSSGNIAVAAYSNSGSGLSAVPGARLGTSGIVACPATGVQDVSLGGSITVEPGDWLALWADNTTATFTISGNGDGAVNSLTAGLIARETGLAGGPPSPAGSTTNSTARPFLLVGVP